MIRVKYINLKRYFTSLNSFLEFNITSFLRTLENLISSLL